MSSFFITRRYHDNYQHYDYDDNDDHNDDDGGIAAVAPWSIGANGARTDPDLGLGFTALRHVACG